MSRISMEEMKERVQTFLATTSLGESIRDVAIKRAYDPEDDWLLRVVVTLERPDRIQTQDARQAIDSLRDKMMATDDRLLVVQFAEAA